MAELPLSFDMGFRKTYLKESVWPSSYNKDLGARFFYPLLNTVGADDTQLTMVFTIWTEFGVAGLDRCRKLSSVSQVIFQCRGDPAGRFRLARQIIIGE